MIRHRSCLQVIMALHCVLIFSGEAFALKYDIHLYRPVEIAKRGITATVRESKSKQLECEFNFEKAKIDVAWVELSSYTEGASFETQLRTWDEKGSLVCRFKLSRKLLMHGHLEIALDDETPGGRFYHIAFVDMMYFGELPPALKKRQTRLIDLLRKQQARDSEETTTAPDKPSDPRPLLQGKIRIIPFRSDESDNMQSSNQGGETISDFKSTAKDDEMGPDQILDEWYDKLIKDCPTSAWPEVDCITLDEWVRRWFEGRGIGSRPPKLPRCIATPAREGAALDE